jgi:hypothetical protein
VLGLLDWVYIVAAFCAANIASSILLLVSAYLFFPIGIISENGGLLVTAGDCSGWAFFLLMYGDGKLWGVGIGLHQCLPHPLTVPLCCLGSSRVIGIRTAYLTLTSTKGSH